MLRAPVSASPASDRPARTSVPEPELPPQGPPKGRGEAAKSPVGLGRLLS